ncbi:MAG: hypothetical protein R3C49_13320 [Planctomycetaceae bacterium]
MSRSTSGAMNSGEFFDIAIGRDAPDELTVLDAQPRLRHLLMSRQDDGKHKFLCGHDERHWFVAAVPERAGASTVGSAFEALQPPVGRIELNRRRVKRKNRHRRRNAAFLRQGEWFFIPIPGKPHVCAELRSAPIVRRLSGSVGI